MKSIVNTCTDCGAEQWSWMGGYHRCLEPHAPYSYFLDPLLFEDDDE